MKCERECGNDVRFVLFDNSVYFICDKCLKQIIKNNPDYETIISIEQFYRIMNKPTYYKEFKLMKDLHDNAYCQYHDIKDAIMLLRHHNLISDRLLEICEYLKSDFSFVINKIRNNDNQ